MPTNTHPHGLRRRWAIHGLISLVSAGLLTLMLHSCGTGGDPGELCDPTPRGAGVCQSGVCLQLDCPDLAKSVCAGQPCACVDSGCFDDVCSDDQLCVLAQNGQAYCLPANVCVVD